jgi:DNA polymerase-1
MYTWSVDFEFRQTPGCLPHPWCVVGQCVETAEIRKLWLSGNGPACPFEPPYRLVAHYAMAELGCYLALGWPMPDAVVDTMAEARTVLGQVRPKGGWGLLPVAGHFGISTMTSEHKDSMRELACGTEVPLERRSDLVDYCLQDVLTLAAVWQKLSPRVNLKQAELRGRFTMALAAIEARGIPVDTDLASRLINHREDIKDASWVEARSKYPGAVTGAGTFSASGWLAWCASEGIPWPLLPSGAPMLDEDTFKKMADTHPRVLVMAYARKLRGQSRGFGFPFGPDGRLRCMMSPFGSDTGRNQPSPTTFIFAASAWLRPIVQAPPSTVLASIDYASQEFGLAGALSGDVGMMEDYRTGDPYLAFGRRAGAIPSEATKSSHRAERNIYKQVALAVQYGMGHASLAQRRDVPNSQAKRLIAQHREAYPAYWTWRQSVIDTVLCGGSVSTAFGWRRLTRLKDSPNSIGNFLVQSSGAEIMRLVIIALEESGRRVIAPIHDGFLVEMAEDGWTIELPQILEKFRLASLAVAPEIEIRTEVDLILPGRHYCDERGNEMWRLVSPIIGRRIEEPGERRSLPPISA